MAATKTEATSSLLILFEFALTILSNESIFMINIVIMVPNNMLRFSSPLILAIFSAKNTADIPAIPNINEVTNHLEKLLIWHTP